VMDVLGCARRVTFVTLAAPNRCAASSRRIGVAAHARGLVLRRRRRRRSCAVRIRGGHRPCGAGSSSRRRPEPGISWCRPTPGSARSLDSGTIAAGDGVAGPAGQGPCWRATDS
jgi:hypothetical protein